MILLAHMLFGAAIGSVIKNIPLAIFIAFLSHYFLDAFPHIEYPIENIKNRQWQKSFPEFLRVSLDFLCGILLILLFSGSQPVIYIYAASAILPDILSFFDLSSTNKLLEAHNDFHKNKIHSLKNKKISLFWRIANQIAVIIISLALFKLPLLLPSFF